MTVKRFTATPILSCCAAALLSVLAVGCQSTSNAVQGAAQATSKAAHQSAKVVSQEYSQAMALGDSINRMIPQLLTSDKPASVADYANELRERVGPQQFQNEQLLQARDGLRIEVPAFQQMRNRMANPRFAAYREKVRHGESVTATGSIKHAMGAPVRWVNDWIEKARKDPADAEPMLGRLIRNRPSQN